MEPTDSSGMQARPRRRTAPRARRVRDTTLFEILMLPVVMAGLSLSMWFSLPTFNEVLADRSAVIEAARDRVVGLARELRWSDAATRGACARALQPSPLRVDEGSRDRHGTGNTELMDFRELRWMAPQVFGEQPHAGELDLYLPGRLTLLIYWRERPPLTHQRMTRKRIAAAIDRPLASRYVVFYRAQLVEPVSATTGAARLDALLVDLVRGDTVCAFALVERSREGEASPTASQQDLTVALKNRFLETLTALTGGTFTD